MAEDADRRVALLSIHPGFAEAILTGTKRVEFRRRGPTSAITHVIVYATAPVSKVVGWFSVADVDASAPADLWHRYGAVGGIARDAFDAYYSSCATGSAIRVGTATKLPSPIDLATLHAGATAPQSYRYVSRRSLAIVRKASAPRRTRREFESPAVAEPA